MYLVGLYQRRLPFRQGSECVEMKWMSRPWRPRWGLHESRMNCHTQVGKFPCRSEGHTMQRAELSRALCGVAAVSEKSGVWLGHTSGLIDGRASRERSPAKLAHFRPTHVRRSRESYSRHFCFAGPSPRGRQTYVFFFALRDLLPEHGSNTWKPPQSSRPSSMMIRPTCPLPTPSRGPSKTSTIPRTCTFVSQNAPIGILNQLTASLPSCSFGPVAR